MKSNVVSSRHQLYGHLPPITKTIQVRRTRHAGHCWRSRDELISDVLLWTPTHGRAKEGRPARTYIQQLCEDTGCCPEDLPRAMNDREKWRERVRDIRATGRHDDDDHHSLWDFNCQFWLLSYRSSWMIIEIHIFYYGWLYTESLSLLLIYRLYYMVTWIQMVYHDYLETNSLPWLVICW